MTKPRTAKIPAGVGAPTGTETNTRTLTNGAVDMSIVPNTPSSAEALAQLEPNDGKDTVLAEVARGAFVAQVLRYDGHDGEDTFTEEPNIIIDCADQEGGQSFHDLTLLPRNIDDAVQTVIEIYSDYTVLTDGFGEIERQDDAFIGEWHRSAGTVGTPSMHVGPDKKEVYASTFWQENNSGQITQPYLAINCGADVAFLPREALAFAAQLLQEASRAVAIESKSEVA